LWLLKNTRATEIDKTENLWKIPVRKLNVNNELHINSAIR